MLMCGYFLQSITVVDAFPFRIADSHVAFLHVYLPKIKKKKTITGRKK